LTIEQRAKGVSWVWIDHPPVNAVGEELMDELNDLTEVLTKDPNVRVVVLTSSHPDIFLAGADLKNIMQQDGENSEEDPIASAAMKMQDCFNQFYLMPKPVIAAINGHGLECRCELALACGFLLMPKRTIGLKETSLTIITGARGTQRLTHRLERTKAMENILLAK